MMAKYFVTEVPPQKRDKARVITKELMDSLTGNPGAWFFYGRANRISFDRAIRTYAKDWMLEMKSRNATKDGYADIYLRFKP